MDSDYRVSQNEEHTDSEEKTEHEQVLEQDSLVERDEFKFRLDDDEFFIRDATVNQVEMSEHDDEYDNR